MARKGRKRKVWTPRFFTTEEALEMVKIDALPTRRPLYVLSFVYKEGYKEHIAIGYINDYTLTIYERDGVKLIVPLHAIAHIRILGEVMA